LVAHASLLEGFIVDNDMGVGIQSAGFEDKFLCGEGNSFD